MNDDVRRVIYGTLIGFLAVVMGWVSFIYINACGFTFTCNRADPLVVRTPIPTLIPRGHEASQMGSERRISTNAKWLGERSDRRMGGGGSPPIQTHSLSLI